MSQTKSWNSIKWVFFDFGGVLAEEGFTEGLKDLGKIQGIVPEKNFQKGHELIYSTGYLLGTAPESSFWEGMRREIKLEGSDTQLRSFVLKRFVPRSWIFMVVEELKNQGLNTAILSDQVDWLDDLDETYDFFSSFDKIFNSFHLGRSKRDAGTFDHVCRMLDVSPEETLFLDDSPTNINRAEKTGLHCIRYIDRNSFLQQLSYTCPQIRNLEKPENLRTALMKHFSSEDASYLNELIYPCLDRESIQFDQISIPEDIKSEYILMAFAERLLIPNQAKQSSCWEDRGLKVQSGESYFMPRFTKNLCQLARITKTFEPETAIRELLYECKQTNITMILNFIRELKKHSRGYKIEAPEMVHFAQQYDLGEELHDLADIFVILGILSPSKSGTLSKGMAKYELNPGLFW